MPTERRAACQFKHCPSRHELSPVARLLVISNRRTSRSTLIVKFAPSCAKLGIRLLGQRFPNASMIIYPGNLRHLR